MKLSISQGRMMKVVISIAQIREKLNLDNITGKYVALNAYTASTTVAAQRS